MLADGLMEGRERREDPSTFRHVGHLVLSHCLQSLLFHSALGFRRESEEVEVCTGQGYDARKNSEESSSHGEGNECSW